MTQETDPRLIKIPQDRMEGDISWLIESIKSQGLLNAPTIKDNMEIVHGAARVRACIAVGLTKIEVNIVPSDWDPDIYKILSLHENLKRKNLQWYDQCILEKELHDLRQDEHGIGKQGKKEGWSLRDTANELEMSFGTLSEDIRLAEAVMADPTLKNIQDKRTAKKLVFSALKRTQQEFDAALPTDIPINCVHNGESSKLLEIYKDNTVDVCITDPPWLEYKEKELTQDVYTLEVFKQVYRVLKNPGFLYLFVGTADWFFYNDNLPKIGFTMQRWPLIWIKEGVLTYSSAPWQYQRDYELIILAVKGAPALAVGHASAIISHPVVPTMKLIHPNEKPVGVISRLLNHCSFDGSIVLDPFAGSGAVLEAAQQSGRRWIGIERDKNYHFNIMKRMGLAK
jgi:adenine-specific DNA-methyltransferase